MPEEIMENVVEEAAEKLVEVAVVDPKYVAAGVFVGFVAGFATHKFVAPVIKAKLVANKQVSEKSAE